MRKRGLLAAFCLAASVGAEASAACGPAPDPVVRLEFGSRYQSDDPTRSNIDPESNADVNKALRPVDDFIRDLARAANTVTRGGASEAELADCVVGWIAIWAWADALSEMDSLTAQLSVGGRLAGIAGAYRQVRPYAEANHRTAAVERWLQKRVAEQVDFWERDAPHGARRGNLRAWASLAIFLTADLMDDDAARYWAFASAARILCSARSDGSLPQETLRGKWGLHYQFHAIGPLVTLAAISSRSGRDPDLRQICDGALARVVRYALEDYAAGGTRTASYSGQVQSYFDGTQELEAHALAWLPAYLTLVPDGLAARRAAELGLLANSKLGGDQRLLWENRQERP